MFARFFSGNQIESVPAPTEPSHANDDVLAFYKILPFNIAESTEQDAMSVRENDPRTSYPVLAPLLDRKTSVLDVGCGPGWMANSLAYHLTCSVTGIDFNPVALERARRVAAQLKLSTRFIETDLFLFQPDAPFDLVVSLGVLHHTNNCAAALRRVCQLVRPGGHIFVGLYHAFGRRPFLDHFAEMKLRGASEDELFNEYARLHSGSTDQTHLRSWFRDQVLHPHETQHTLKEILPIIVSEKFRLIATSLNRFEDFSSADDIIAGEQKWLEVGRARLEAQQYFPGFFVFLARKERSPR